MFFAHPQALWLLIAAAALAYAGWRAADPRRWAVAVLRLLCVSALVLSLAGPTVAWHAADATAVSVIEVGPGVADAALARVAAGLPSEGPVVVFSNRSELLTDRKDLTDASNRVALRQRLSVKLWSDDPASGGANLAAALQLASGQVPPLGKGEVRLYATGLSDHGDAAAAAWRLAERGIAVRCIPFVVDAAPTVRVVQVNLPGQARVGQTLRADVTIEATVSGAATVSLTPGSDSPNRTSVAIPAGLSHVSLDLPLSTPGLVPVRAAAWLGDAASGAAETLQAAVEVRSAARVLLVENSDEPGPAAALAALLGNGTRLLVESPATLAAKDFAAADAVILSDVPADQLSVRAQQALLDAVRGGTGLLLTGAARSFGPGGYDDSILAPLLPVRMSQQAESIDPSTTVVLIIDTSASMFGQKIDLAKEVARLAMSHLKSHDKVGIVEFYGGKRWAAPIQSAGNVAVIGRALDRLTAGGSTVLYPAIEEAAFALRNVHTRFKQLLVLSDGDVEDAPIDSLVRQMVEEGIFVSAVQVGASDPSDAANIMPDLARWGNGHYYTVPDQYALPDIRFKEPQVSMTSPVILAPAGVVAGDDDLLRDAATGPWPAVHGYVRTRAKPTADVLLKTSGGDPLMVRWRYGIGFVAAVPTQLGSAMTAALQNSPQFGRVVTGLVRQLDDGRGEPLNVTATVRPAGIEVDIAAAAGTEHATAPLQLTVRDAAGVTVRHTPAELISPQHWNVLLTGMTSGSHQLTITDGSRDGVTDAVAVAPPRSVGTRSDAALLARLASFADLAARQAETLPAQRPTYCELQKPLATTAVLLLVTMVAVRRWPRSNFSRERSGYGPAH